MAKKILFLLLTCALMFLCACADMVAFDSEQVLAHWSGMQQKQLEELLLVQDEQGQIISSAETAARICNIMEALAITKVTVTPQEARVTSTKDFPTVYAQDVTITYQSDLFGSFSFEACAHFARVEDVWRLLWEYDLLFPQMQQSDTVNFTQLSAARGEIFTSDRECIAGNTFAPTLYVRPDSVSDENAAAEAVSAICGMPADEILSLMRSEKAQRDGVAVIHVYSPAQDITTVRAAVASVPGVGIDESYMSPMRLYPLGDKSCLLSNLVGYVGAIGEESLEEYEARGYSAYDTVGITGLESAYESTLRGTNGYVLSLLDEKGETRVTLARKEAQNGADLTLTIDSRVQLALERELAQRLHAGQSASALSLDPTTGAMRAMASYPTYDNNFFTLPAADEASYQAQWEAINSEAGNYPLLFRCINGRYTPGSTAKVMTAAAALESGKLTSDYTFTGAISNNVWTPRRSDWYYPGITRHSSYGGPINMTNALIHSDNIYFADVAMQLGNTTFIDSLTRFGFFDKLPFDLNVYSAQVSSSEDKTLVENIKFLADLGYGQGQMLCTPLQMAMFYSAFANGGNIMTPYVVAHIDRTQNGENVRLHTTEPTVWKQDIVSPTTIETLVPMMRGVVESGTAGGVKIPGLGVAGKTGTGETGIDRQHSWFIGFTTEGNDPLLACVTLDVKSRQGGAVQPLAKLLFTAQGSQQTTDDQTAPQADSVTPGGDEVQ